jgi:UDP-glucose 4-epimerase
MKIMITGAAGFIGSQLAYKLWKDGKELVLIDNFSYGKMDNLEFPDHSFKEEIIKMDIRDKEGIASLLKNGDVDYIYNIAGIAPLPDCQINPQEAIEVNTVGLVNLLENARKYGVKKVIQASTNAMYENETKYPTKEDKFELPTLIYPNTKYCAERFAQSFCDTYGMSVSCLRFANVYGPHIDCLRKQPPFVAYMIRELYYDRTPVFHSDGTQRRDYIYVDDLIDLAIKVQNHKGFDCVNVSSNSNYSVNEMYQMACKIMNKDIKSEYAEDSHYWEKYPEMFNGAYSIKDEILEHEIKKYTLCDNSYAKKVYDWTPKISMEEGLKLVIENECELLKKLDLRGEDNGK